MASSTRVSEVIVGLKQRVPWPAKLAAKIILSRLPVPYGIWKALAAFEHGHMDRPEYALGSFERHWKRAHFEGKKLGGFVALELGPGDSLFSALIASAFGASKTYLVDVGPFAGGDLKSYRGMAQLLESRGFSLPGFASARTLEELLTSCSAVYLTHGLSSLRQIPYSSVDFVWSHAVLEHVRRDDFAPLLHELRRVQKPAGASSHTVDLKDHLGGALNNLRFAHTLWESDFMAKSGFYTNRIRYTEMIDLFCKAGFQPHVLDVDRWPELPTPRKGLAKPFSALPHEELVVSGFDVLLH